MNKRLQQALAFWGVAFLLCLPMVADAALVPCSGTPADPCTVEKFFTLLTNVYNFLLELGGVVALLFIIWGGVQMILGFLDGGEHMVQAGKDTVKHGVIGLLLLACGYLIVNTIIMVLGGGGINQLLAPIFK